MGDIMAYSHILVNNQTGNFIMSDSISLTIPMNAGALNEAAVMLYNISAQLNGGIPVAPPSAEPTQAECDAKLASMSDVPEIPKPVVTAETPTPPIATTVTPSAPEQPAMVHPGVEIDADGLPWDVRIHGKARLKLKKTQCWKKIKNVDAELVTIVEAELRAAMAASPAAPITPAAPVAEVVEATPPPIAPVATPEPQTPVAPAPEQMYLVEGAPFTAKQLTDSGWSEGQIAQCEKAEAAPAEVVAITFPEIMSKITAAINAKQIIDTAVTTALGNQGLTSLPLLAARPDLIPAINAELFPNG